MPKTKPKRKPLTVSIHGEGIDIDVKLDYTSGLEDAMTMIIERLQGVRPPPQATSPQGNPFDVTHHFDVVQSVIKHSDKTVLEAIMTLVKAELEVRATAS
jgi:hypothetical protein